MNNEGYDPDAIAHIPGQEGSEKRPLTKPRIGASEEEQNYLETKAEHMADMELYHRKLADLYRRYLALDEKPTDFNNFIRPYDMVDRAGEVPEDSHRTARSVQTLFEILSDIGVQPKYLDALADRQGEITGALYDAREGLSRMTDAELEHKIQKLDRNIRPDWWGSVKPALPHRISSRLSRELLHNWNYQIRDMMYKELERRRER